MERLGREQDGEGEEWRKLGVFGWFVENIPCLGLGLRDLES